MRADLPVSPPCSGREQRPQTPTAAARASSRRQHAGPRAPHRRWLPEGELGWPAPREMPAVCMHLIGMERADDNDRGSYFTLEEPKAWDGWGVQAPLVSVWLCSLLSC